MATSNPFASSALASVIGCPVTERLVKNNHALWKAQVMSALRGAEMAHLIDSKKPAPAATVVPNPAKPTETQPNPEFDTWMVKDQHVLNFLLSSISCDILTQVAASSTAAELWDAIEVMFASQSRARVINTRMALATAQKGTSTVSEYFGRMKTLADEMASAGKKLDDEEMSSYILAGLDIDFHPVVSAIAASKDPLSLSELYTQLVGFEQCLDLQQGGGSNLSANIASRGGRNGGSGGNSRGRGNSSRGGR